jgi:hypothetical protein
MTPSKRRRTQLRALATVAAVVGLAAALLACQGGMVVSDAPSRSVRAQERRTSAAEPGAVDAPPGAVIAPDADDGAGDGPAPAIAVPVATRWAAGSASAQGTEAASSGEPRAAADAALAPAGPPVIEDVWPTKGPATGGDRVEIRGRNLRPSLVLFGSVPATVLGVRDEGGTVTVTLQAPPARAGAARVYVVVTNPDGQYAVAGERFEYYD